MVKLRFLHLAIASTIFVSSCKGQNEAVVQKERSEVIATEKGQTKIPKPKGTYSSAAIDRAMQDKAGNIWFTSNGEGIYRYNGTHFHNFTVADGLDNNIVYSILEDKSGTIWAGTKTGLNRYDGKTFTPVKLTTPISFNLPHLPATPSKENAVWSIMQDSKGTLWFGTDDAVYCYDGKNFSFFLANYNILNKDQLKLKAIFSILEDKNGHIWFGSCTEEGISRFDGVSLTAIVPHKDILRTNDILETKDGTLWFSTSFSGLCSYDGKTFLRNVFKAKGSAQSNAIQDKSGNLWLSTADGIASYDGKTLNVLTDKEGLPKENVWPVLEDKSGNLWFSSVAMGLYRYDGKSFSKLSE